MSDTSGTNGGKRLAVYAIRETPEREADAKARSRWIRIGIAHLNRDGSMNLYLDAFPIGTNKLQVREDDRAQPAGRRDLETVEVRS
jgi:hypothetical protein